MSFDADSAGIEAALRGIDVALRAGLHVKILEIPKNELGEPIVKDPDELVKKAPELWKKAVQTPKHIIDFYIDTNLCKYKLDDPKENADFCNLIISQIKKIKTSVERALWLKKLSVITGVHERDLRVEILKGRQNTAFPIAIKETEKIQEKNIEFKYLALLLGVLNEESQYLQAVSSDMLNLEIAKEFYRHIILYYNDNKLFNLDKFRAWIEELGKDTLILDKLLLLKDKEYANCTEDEVQRELKALSLYIINSYIKNKRKVLEKEMMLIEKEGNDEKMKNILEEFKKLNV